MSVSGFVGRRTELQSLRERLDRVGPSGFMLAVHGRRQCGKSTLLTELVESSGLPYLYFTALKGGSVRQQMELLAEAARQSRHPLTDAEALFAVPPADWGDALGRIAIACRHTRSIVVVDELPWAIEADPTLEGRLKIAWDTALKRLPVLLCVVGSDVSTMEAIERHDHPLYGISSRFRLRAFSPSDVRELTECEDALEVFDDYLVTGGYPGLVSELARHGECSAFVKEQLSDANSPLVTVAQLTLNAELEDAVPARRVLSAIGWSEVGHATFSQIVSRISEVNATVEQSTSRALNHLLELKRLIALETPIGANPKTKLRRYRVDDTYLTFWFRFVERHVADIVRGRSELAIADFERGWSSWRGKAIEPVVRDAIFRLAWHEKILEGLSEIGAWWVRDGSREYDIAGSDRGGQVLAVGSIKWRTSRQFSARERTELAQARADIPRASDAKLIAACPAGLADGVEVDFAPSPEALLAAWQ